jgi:hypothetical protein
MKEPKGVKELMEDKESLIKSNLIPVMEDNKKLSEQNKELLEALKAAYQVVLALSTDTDTPLVRQIESTINKYTKP